MTATTSETMAYAAVDGGEAATVTEMPSKAEAKKRPRALYVLSALTLIAAAAGGAYYAHGVGRESTDDAQVEGHIMNVSTRIPGQVARVLVQDNQMVNEGDLLIELDRSDFDAKAESARADLAAAQASLENARAQLALTERNASATVIQAQGGLTQAAATVTSSRAAIDQGDADVAAAQARLTLAQADWTRVKQLASQNVISTAEVDAAQSQLDQAKAQIDQARARVASAKAGVNGSTGGVVFAQGRLAQAMTGPQQVDAARAALTLAEARVKQSESALRLADLNVSYTQIRAPHRGQISRRTVEAGQMVSSERPLLAVVPLDDVWVVANFKEDQLREMHPGEPVSVEIDTFGGRVFHGHVDSLASASGARFALLPPDNATGNFIKVVQRIPVLIRIDDENRPELRPGMSANVTVDTRSHG